MTFSRLWRVPVVFSVIFVLLIIFGLPLLWIMGAKAKYRQVTHETAKERRWLQAADIPLTPNDLRRSVSIPDADNAAPFYEQLTKRFMTKQAQLEQAEKKALTLLKAESYTEEQITYGRKLLTLIKSEMPLIIKASQKSGCDFQRPYEQGAGTEFPEYSQMRRAVRCLAVNAVLLEREGKDFEALKQIEIGSKVAQHAGKDPNLIALLVQIALEVILDRQWHKLVNRHADNKEFLAKAARIGNDFGPLPDLRFSLKGEVVMGLVMVEQMRTRTFNYQGADLRKQDFERYMPPRNAGIYEKHMLSFWRKAYEAMNAANGESMPTYLALQKVGTEEDKAANLDKAGHMLNVILLPVVGESGWRVVQMQAMRRMRTLKIELLKYRLAHNDFPADLKQFDVITATDPFDGKPLRYRRKGKGFRLWSIGDNLKDDGGQLKIGDQRADIVTSYP